MKADCWIGSPPAARYSVGSMPCAKGSTHPTVLQAIAQAVERNARRLCSLSRLRFRFAPFVLGLDHLLEPMGEAAIVVTRHRVRPFLKARPDLRVNGRRANFRFGLLHADFITANLKTTNARALYSLYTRLLYY